MTKEIIIATLEVHAALRQLAETATAQATYLETWLNREENAGTPTLDDLDTLRLPFKRGMDAIIEDLHTWSKAGIVLMDAIKEELK